MTRTLLIPFLALLATVAATTEANAAPVWVDSPSQFIPLNCAPHGLGNSIETWVGYEDDTAAPLKTGDSRYVHAVAKSVGPCADGVTMEIFLPAGATRDPSKPVYCVREKVDGQIDDIQNCAPGGFVGPNGGLMFTSGAVTLVKDWYLEIQIPVIYNAELLGAAGGNTHQLGVKTMNTLTSALPSTPVTVGYRAKLENPTASGVTASSAIVALNLVSYFKSGQFSIEYGTTTALGMSTIPASVSSQHVSYPNSGATLTNLGSGTTYYWRGRYVTSSGTFVSTTQSFTTSFASLPVLTLATSGHGLGKITSNPVHFDCGAYSSNVCSAATLQGFVISLYATPSSPAYVFTGWSGACTGTGACTLTMDASKSVTASFDFYDIGSATPITGPYPRRW